MTFEAQCAKLRGRCVSHRRVARRLNAVRRSAASGPDPPPRAAAAGSTPPSATTPAIAPAAGSASRVRRRSSLCARIADATERAGQKIILQRQLANLGVQRLDVRTMLPLLRRGREHLCCPLQQLRLPLRYLVRMDIEPFSQLYHRVVTLDGCQRYLGLESR